METKTKGTWGGARPNTGGARLTYHHQTKRATVTKSVQFRLNAEQAAIVKQFVKMLKAGEITLDDFKKE